MRTRFSRIFPVFIGCLIHFSTLSAVDDVSGHTGKPALPPIPEEDCIIDCNYKYFDCCVPCKLHVPLKRYECERTCFHKLTDCVSGCPPPS